MLSLEDKKGQIPHPDWLISGFKEVIDDCNLHEIPLHGYPYTWERGRGSSNWVQERLDRVFVTETWLCIFPLCKLT